MASGGSFPAVRPDEMAELKRSAKQLFMDMVPHNDICQRLKVPSAQLAAWRRDERWVEERESIEQATIDDAVAIRRMKVVRILRSTTDQLERGLRHLEERVDPPTLTEIKALSDIMANVDKIARLDAGKATEHVSTKTEVSNAVTVDDMRELLKRSDPFYQEPDVNDNKP